MGCLFAVHNYDSHLFQNKTQHGRLLTMTELLVAAIFEMGMFCYYANRVRDEVCFSLNVDVYTKLLTNSQYLVF